MPRRPSSLNVAFPPRGSRAGGMRAAGGASRATVPSAGMDGDALVQERGRWKLVQRTIVFAGFLLYIFVITTYRFQVGDFAVALALVGLAFQKEPLRFPAPLGWFTLLLVWVGLGYSATAYPDAVRPEVVNFLKLGLILLVMVNAIRSRSQLRAFIVFWLGCFALFPLRGAYLTYFAGGYTVEGRAVWNYIYRNPNDLAGLTILMLGLCVGVLVSEANKWFRRAALLGTILLSLLIFLTQSRGAFLGFAVFALAALIIYEHRMRAIGMAVVAGVVILLAAPADVWDRFGALSSMTDTENLGEIEDEGSAQQRFNIWMTALRITADHPAFGVGWGAYPNANGAYSPTTGGGEIELGNRDAHSTYLRTSAETGLPGLLIFLTLIGITFRYAEVIRRRCRRFMPRAAQQLFFAEVGMVGFLVAGIFGSYSRLSFFYLYLVLIWIIARVCEQDLRLLRSAPPRRAPQMA